MTKSTALSQMEQLLLDYARDAKKRRSIVWLSEAIEELRLDPREAVQRAKLLERRGLLKPKKKL